MSCSIDGMDELQEKLKRIEREVDELGEGSVPLSEVLTPAFIQNCSVFSSLEELVERSGFAVESQEEFEAIPEAEWDAYIRQQTPYTSWQHMIQEAGMLYAKHKLGL